MATWMEVLLEFGVSRGLSPQQVELALLQGLGRLDQGWLSTPLSMSSGRRLRQAVGQAVAKHGPPELESDSHTELIHVGRWRLLTPYRVTQQRHARHLAVRTRKAAMSPA